MTLPLKVKNTSAFFLLLINVRPPLLSPFNSNLGIPLKGSPLSVLLDVGMNGSPVYRR